MKNIVICCDGTGNEISENISNALKLYRTLRKTEKTTPRQMVFYDPGVGTLARPNPWKKLVQDASAIFGLATGYGLDDNVLDCLRIHRRQLRERRRDLSVRLFPWRLHRAGAGGPDPQGRAGRASSRSISRARGSPPTSSSPATTRMAGSTSSNSPTAVRSIPACLKGRPGRAVCADPFGEMADHQIRRGLGHRGQRHRAPAGPVLSSEPAGAWLVHRNPSVEIFRQAISIDEWCRLFRRSGGKRGGQNLAQLLRPEGQMEGPAFTWSSVRRRARRYRRRLSGGSERAVEISAAVDDRGSREMRPQGRLPHRQSARLGPATQEQSVRYVKPDFLPDPRIRSPPPGNRTIR